MSALNLLLAAIIVYIPYQSHVPLGLGIPGLNLTNALFLTALVLILLRKTPTESPTPLKGNFVLFIATLVLAFFIGQFYDGSRLDVDAQGLKNCVFYILLYFLFFHGVREVKDIRFLLAVMLAITFLVSLHVIRQALDYGIGNYSETRRAGRPFAADYRGANLAAAFFVMFLPLYFGLAFHRTMALRVRLASLVMGAIGVFAAFFTYSRQAYIILAVLGLIQAVRHNLLIGVFLGLMILSYEVWVPEAMLQRIEMTNQAPEESDEAKLDSSTESRFVLWTGAAKMIAERPWGVGLNRFAREMGKYVPGFFHFDVHNGYLLVAAEAGVISAIILITLLIRLILLGRRIVSSGDSEDARALGKAFQISVLAAMLANLFGSRFFNGEVMGNFWILAGLVARYHTLQIGLSPKEKLN